MSLQERRLQLLEQLTEKQAARDSIAAQLANPNNPNHSDPNWAIRAKDSSRHILREIRELNLELTKVKEELNQGDRANHRALLRCALAYIEGSDEDVDEAFDHLDRVYPRWKEIALKHQQED